MNKMVLLRHAESLWNLENRFTGWTDVGLSKRGIEEARRAGHLLASHGFEFDEAHTSVLKRARDTLSIVLKDMHHGDLPVFRDWRLNERHYGALQGLNKADTAAQFGEQQLHEWRRSYYARPPALEPGDPRHPGNDILYADIDPAQLPATESLEDTTRRVVPYWEQNLAPHIVAGRSLLVVAHGNSLRALVKHLENLSAEEVERLEIPTGRPLVYEFAGGLRVARRYYLETLKDTARSAA
jgi:2,3-bisphosphoglycerate-dependent phosphoglycerate mutase